MRHGSRYLEIWESTDLVTWSDQRHVPVSARHAGHDVGAGGDLRPGHRRLRRLLGVAVPYAADDPDHTGSTYPRMMYSTTRDFRTFTDAAGLERPRPTA